MVNEGDEVGENRYREEYGRIYETFEVGEVYEHRPKRTVTRADDVWFTSLTMNTHPPQFDAEYAGDAEVENEIVNSTLALSIATGMSVSDVSYRAIANLGWGHVTLGDPLFHGDTLSAESEVLEKRESKSREGLGIVTVETTGFKQTDDEVLSFERSIVIPLGNEYHD